MTEGYNSDFWFRWRDTVLRRQQLTANQADREEVREVPITGMTTRFVARNHLTIGGQRVAFPEWSEE